MSTPLQPGACRAVMLHVSVTCMVLSRSGLRRGELSRFGRRRGERGGELSWSGRRRSERGELSRSGASSRGPAGGGAISRGMADRESCRRRGDLSRSSRRRGDLSRSGRRRGERGDLSRSGRRRCERGKLSRSGRRLRERGGELLRSGRRRSTCGVPPPAPGTRAPSPWLRGCGLPGAGATGPGSGHDAMLAYLAAPLKDGDDGRSDAAGGNDLAVAVVCDFAERHRVGPGLAAVVDAAVRKHAAAVAAPAQMSGALALHLLVRIASAKQVEWRPRSRPRRPRSWPRGPRLRATPSCMPPRCSRRGGQGRQSRR